jgi:hypothetical protein
VTKLGQNPSTHAKSSVQAEASMRRFSPSGVSTGVSARQFDRAPQSPQSSHTSSLMNACTAGAGCAPRLMRRRFSVAQS